MANPRFTHRFTFRNHLRPLGAFLFVVGVAGLVAGAVVFARGSLADDLHSMGRSALIGVLVFGVSGVVTVAGVSALSAGFLRARTLRASRRYVATEPLPVGPDPLAFLSDDGFLGAGWADEDRPVE
jgi:hypothetical protein